MHPVGAGRLSADHSRKSPQRHLFFTCYPDVLDRVHVPTLLIVGGADFGVIELNEQAFAMLRGPKALEIVPGASHLFPEPGALEAVIEHAARWFERYLAVKNPKCNRAA